MLASGDKCSIKQNKKTGVIKIAANIKDGATGCGVDFSRERLDRSNFFGCRGKLNGYEVGKRLSFHCPQRDGAREKLLAAFPDLRAAEVFEDG